MALFWLTFLLSLIYSNLGTQYYGSRRIYTKTSTSALCADYIEVTFDFDDTSTEVVINIFSSTNASWFSVGFPDTSLYYDKSTRNTDIMNGYALVYINDELQEHAITGTNNIINNMVLHTQQNINVTNLVNDGTVSITLTRNLATNDISNDFEFDLFSYVDCFPLLMSVAIGDGLILGADNSFGSSYIYFYKKSKLLNQSPYNQMWEVDLMPNDIESFLDANVTVFLTMDPSTELVSIKIEDGPGAPAKARAWGLSFPDLADIAYYHPEDTDPIGMITDYSILWGDVRQRSVMCIFGVGDTAFTEARIPVDGPQCAALLLSGTNHTECWDPLPNPQVSNTSYTNINYQIDSKTVYFHTFEFDLNFKSCGYEFNPYEYSTCRPLTMVSVATPRQDVCLSAFEDNANGVHHTIAKVQIDDFNTSAPTFSPVAAPSLSPTEAPTLAPTQSPSDSPVSPTTSPTDITLAPTSAPSGTPTAKPTDLPTKFQLHLDYPPCAGMRVKHLDTLFPIAQAVDEFNEEAAYYNGRRVWNNGKGLIIHWVNRFEDGGDWVITNGSYSAISIIDSNLNNSLTYNTSDPAAVSPNAVPGPYPSGYVYYDHFPHDNILQKPDSHKTLYFECGNTSYPTADPSPAPTTVEPTLAPATGAPTMAPTGNCSALCIESIKVDQCIGDIAELFVGCYNKQEDVEGRATWNGVEAVSSYTIYWSSFHEQWLINSDDGYVAFTEGTERAPPGLDDRIGQHQIAEWSVFNHENPFLDPCFIHFKYYCYGAPKPTYKPTSSPTTAIPTTAEPSTDPTTAPSVAPTTPPTLAPSLTPTLAPTGSPIVDCLGIGLSGTDVLDGLYRQEVNKTIAGKMYWQQVHGDAVIFWSDSVLHDSWVINSPSKYRYWLSQPRPPLQPPLDGDWDLYEGATPFISESRILELECFSTLPPTPAPTMSPSNAPSAAPSNAPSNDPTNAPSSAPSAAPSAAPTGSPTTLSPTLEPTFDPTADPTTDPTAEPCDFMVITSNNNEPQVDKYNGVYNYMTIGNRDAWRMDGERGWYILTHNNKWTITTNDGSGLQLEIEGSMKRPPYVGKTWRFSTDLMKLNYTLEIECSMTNVPTQEPTAAPSLSPTGAPTSSCRGLRFVNEDNANFKYNGWYRRKDNFQIDHHKWWIKDDLKASIEYINSAWYLMQTDSAWDPVVDEDPIMVITNGSDLLSPPSGVWQYVSEFIANGTATARITIHCIHSASPSEDPSPSPSRSPTEYIPMSWELCWDWQPFFHITTENDSAVYWPEPILNEHLYDLNIEVIPANTTPGDVMDLGKHMLTYVATDTKNVSIECNMTIYVVAGSKWSSTHWYCVRQTFRVDLRFNDSYYELAEDEVSTDNEDDDDDDDDDDDESNIRVSSVPEIVGRVYDPQLVYDGQGCMVLARQISNYAPVHVDDSPATSSFFGISAYSLIWEILILIFCAIVLGLIVHCLCGIYKNHKNESEARDKEQTEKLLAAQELAQEEEEAGALQGGDIELQKQPTTEVEIPDNGSDDD